MIDDLHVESHFIARSSWLRAAILGANDGILSTASIAVGIAAASVAREPIVLATSAGLIAGAISMAAGEYISVSSQADMEASDLQRETIELRTEPEKELNELAAIYRTRGLSDTLAMQVAKELTEKDALGAHARDELGLTPHSQARPMQAALASGASFLVGGLLPMLVSVFAPLPSLVLLQYVFCIGFLALLGSIAARVGGSSLPKAIVRITFWGTLAMGITALAGHLVGTAL